MFGYVFDLSTLVSLGAGRHESGALLASLHDRDVRVSVPAVTLAYAFAELSPARSAELLGIIEAMSNVAVQPLDDTFAALELAEILGLIPDDPGAAHALITARTHDMEIITVDRARWRAAEQRLPFRTPLVELSDDYCSFKSGPGVKKSCRFRVIVFRTANEPEQGLRKSPIWSPTGCATFEP